MLYTSCRKSQKKNPTTHIANDFENNAYSMETSNDTSTRHGATNDYELEAAIDTDNYEYAYARRTKPVAVVSSLPAHPTAQQADSSTYEVVEQGTKETPESHVPAGDEEVVLAENNTYAPGDFGPHQSVTCTYAVVN